MIALEVGGVPFTNFLSMTIKKSMEDLSGTFNFRASNADKTTFPIKAGDAVKITYYNSKNKPFVLITGFVDMITPSVDPNSHDVYIQGRDVTCDIVDSTLGEGSVIFNNEATLTQIIQTALASIGSSIKIINQAGTITNPSSIERPQGQAGQGVFDFIEKQARLRAVLLTTDGLGNLIITRTGTDDSKFTILNQYNNSKNNVLYSSATYDLSKRFNKYICVSQKNLVAMNDSEEDSGQEDDAAANEIAIDNGIAYDKDIRAGRTLTLVVENASSSDQLTQRAKWEASVRKARSLTYTASVYGMENPETNNVFVFNQLVNVIDDNEGLSVQMLIKSLVFTVEVDGGTTTQFECVDRNAYSLDLNEPIFYNIQDPYEAL